MNESDYEKSSTTTIFLITKTLIDDKTVLNDKEYMRYRDRFVKRSHEYLSPVTVL